jgi:hypothetical protein
MDSEYETFITAQSQKKYPPPTNMLSALKSLLADPSTPPSSAAREAVSCFIKESNPDPDYTSLWPLLFATIEKFTDQNDRLVDFVAELQSLPHCNGAFARLDGLSEYMTEFVFDCMSPPIISYNLKLTKQMSIIRFMILNAMKSGKVGSMSIPSQPSYMLGAFVLIAWVIFVTAAGS